MVKVLTYGGVGALVYAFAAGDITLIDLHVAYWTAVYAVADAIPLFTGN